MKENGFTLAKARSRRYPPRTITDANYADDIALLANTHAQAHGLERAAGGIGFHINADQTEFMRFNQRDDIFTLNSRYLQLVENFTYLGSSISSTKNYICT